MKIPHIAQRVFNTPLLIEQGKLETVLEVLKPRMKSAAFDVDVNAMAGEEPAQSRAAPYYITPDGIAVISVVGSLVQRYAWVNPISGLVSYDVIRGNLEHATRNEQVRAILLEIDSYGGEVAGCFDLADVIHNATKPVWAIANEAAYSAGYALACPAERVYVPRTGGMGSIGVIAVHIDQSKADEKAGLTYTPVFAGSKKADFSPHAPLTGSAKGTLQGRVDACYGLFVQTVAAYRGLDEKTVRDTEAGLFYGQDAVTAGLADGVATLEEVLAELSEHIKTGANDMKKENPAGAEAKPAASVDNTPAPAQAQPAPAPEAQAPTPSSEPNAAQAERARIAAIMDAPEAKGKERLARTLAMETGLSVESAVNVLKKSPLEAASDPLGHAMANVENPDVGPASDAGAEADEASKLAAEVLNSDK